MKTAMELLQGGYPVKFRVIKQFSDVKVGKVYDSFGGLVSGVNFGNDESVSFSDSEYFKLVQARKKDF